MKEVPPKHDRIAPREWFSLFQAHGGWFALIAAVICIGVTFGSVAQYRAAAAYERVGIEAQAEAVSRRVRHDSEGSDDYYVTYRFVVGEITIQRERKVSRSQHSRSAPGTSHTIRYLPDTPREFESYVGEAHDDAVSLQWFAGIAGVGSLIALWFLGGRTNRSVLTRRFGYRAVARIEAIREVRRKGRSTGRGRMTWKTTDGVTGKSLVHRLKRLEEIGVGAEINVYVRKGHSVWEGDVGPQETEKSNLPSVPRS